MPTRLHIGAISATTPHCLHKVQRLWHNHGSAMLNDSHRSTSSHPAGTAGRSSYAGYRRTYAWRFI
jgi:hypothetical protein